MLKRFVVLLLLLLSIQTIYAQDATAEPVSLRTAPPDPALVEWVEVVRGLTRPLAIVSPDDGSQRMFLLEQNGRILILENTTLYPAPFLDVSNLLTRDVFVSQYTERGLLGLAFHPDYETNGWFFINYTDQNGNSVIARYSVSESDPNVADPSSALTILTQEQPYANHNGGQLAFGPDGYLYIGFGDGGSQGDPQNNAQSPNTWLGKLLRIDVNTEPYGIPADNPFVDDPTYLPEIWSLGFRNPWRFSFDRLTGDLYIADVGQNVWEEISFQAASSTGGENYGWNRFEASTPYQSGANSEGLMMPITEYSHNSGACSVTGGFVYRGEMLPDLQGAYLFGDWCTGEMWTTYPDASDVWNTNLFMDTQYSISAFGEDEQGELYLADYYGGRILRLMPVLP